MVRSSGLPARQSSTLPMSGDGKRSVAEWPKLPRPSSTLPFETCRLRRAMSEFEVPAQPVDATQALNLSAGVGRTQQRKATTSESDPTGTSSLIASSSAINLKTAKALGIDIPATLLGRAAFCSLDGLRAQPHDAVSAFTGSVN